MIALVDGERPKRKGKNKYTADSYITDTHKKCSWCFEIKEHKDFSKDKKNVYCKGLSYYCKLCAAANSRRYHKARATDLEYKTAKRNQWIKLIHGITLNEYEAKLALQGHKCSICSVTLASSGTHTHLDHNHTTGKLRDFLCTNCNRGLGHFQDNQEILMAAIEYLKAHTDNGNQKEGSRP